VRDGHGAAASRVKLFTASFALAFGTSPGVDRRRALISASDWQRWLARGARR
jgi:hypothetical protein